MHRCILIWVALLVITPAGIFPQEQLRVMFYNVENLFDTKDDSLKNDNEFLPDGFMRWTPWKYWEKLRDITRVITLWEVCSRLHWWGCARLKTTV